MNQIQYFSTVSRQSLGSKQKLFSSAKYSTVSDYASQRQDNFLQIPNQQNCLEVFSQKQQQNSKKRVYFGDSQVKKAIKTIKLKTNLKTQTNENESDKIIYVKNKLKLNRSSQNTEKLFENFKKSELGQHNNLSRVYLINQIKDLSQNKTKLKNFETPNNNHSRFLSSHQNTSRFSQMYSISPIKDKFKLQSKLKKVQALYESSVKNYKQILIKFQIELQKVKLLEKHRQSFKTEKLLLQKLILQKQSIILSKQQLISNQCTIINQKQQTIKQYQAMIIQSQSSIINKNKQNQLLKYQNQLKSNHYQQSIKKYENDVLFLNKQLQVANNKNKQSNIVLNKYFQDMDRLKKQKNFLVQRHVQQLYQKNKIILELNQNLGSRTNYYKEISEIKHYTQSNSLQLSNEIDQKSLVITQTQNCSKQQNVILFSEQQIILTDENQFVAIKRDTLMDMKQVMSVQASQCSYRDKFE